MSAGSADYRFLLLLRVFAANLFQLPMPWHQYDPQAKRAVPRRLVHRCCLLHGKPSGDGDIHTSVHDDIHTRSNCDTDAVGNSDVHATYADCHVYSTGDLDDHASSNFDLHTSRNLDDHARYNSDLDATARRNSRRSYFSRSINISCFYAARAGDGGSLC